MIDIKKLVENYKYNTFIYARFLNINKVGMLHSKSCVTPTYFFIFENNEFKKYRVNLEESYSFNYLETIDRTKIINFNFLKKKYIKAKLDKEIIING